VLRHVTPVLALSQRYRPRSTADSYGSTSRSRAPKGVSLTQSKPAVSPTYKALPQSNSQSAGCGGGVHDISLISHRTPQSGCKAHQMLLDGEAKNPVASTPAVDEVVDGGALFEVGELVVVAKVVVVVLVVMTAVGPSPFESEHERANDKTTMRNPQRGSTDKRIVR
jgi:hypothetical protein